MAFWKNRRVLITGHTGFKGSWLSLWLQQLGADLCGYSLAPPTVPSLFLDARIGSGMRSITGDVRDLEHLRDTLLEFQPEVVMHLAAQPLVRLSYSDPVTTYATNVMGTVNVLEAVRACETVRAVVIITTDKCYENKEWLWGYREGDRLGGYDPYSNSKACAELAVSAYRNSFFNPNNYNQHGVAIASVRAGNVIGGGDWAEDRLIPDIIRAFLKHEPVIIRNPGAIRPWQHVLEPLRGYMRVAERLFNDGPAFGESWNFGPELSDAVPVESIVQFIGDAWGEGAQWKLDSSAQPHEANFLKLDYSKAAARLSWRPALRLVDALKLTIEWYKSFAQGAEIREFTLQQIETYAEIAAAGSTTRSHGAGAE